MAASIVHNRPLRVKPPKRKQVRRLSADAKEPVKILCVARKGYGHSFAASTSALIIEACRNFRESLQSR